MTNGNSAALRAGNFRMANPPKAWRGIGRVCVGIVPARGGSAGEPALAGMQTGSTAPCAAEPGISLRIAELYQKLTR